MALEEKKSRPTRSHLIAATTNETMADGGWQFGLLVVASKDLIILSEVAVAIVYSFQYSLQLLLI